MRLIADGVVDREGVPGLAVRLGYSTRHLQRLLLDEVGAGPVAIARAQRAQTARILIETTALPISQVAFAAGFSSVRQFNDTVRIDFRPLPVHPAGPGAGGEDAGRGRGRLRSSCTSPSAGRSVPTTSSGTSPLPPCPAWRRCATAATAARCASPTAPGIIELAPTPERIVCRVSISDLRDLTTTIARCRRLLDLDADPLAVDTHLARRPGPRPAGGQGARPSRAPLRRRRRDGHPGRARPARLGGRGPERPPGPWWLACGERLSRSPRGLTHLFPEPAAVRAEVSGLPASRRRALVALAAALADGELSLGPGMRPSSRARGACPACPASGPGRCRRWPCGRSATPMPSRPATSGCVGPPATSACPDRTVALAARAEVVAPVARLRRPVPLGRDRPPCEPLAASRRPGHRSARHPIGRPAAPAAPSPSPRARDRFDRLDPSNFEEDR